MKLLTKEKLLQTPVYLILFILVGISFYYAAQIVLHEDVESILRARKRYIVQNIANMEEFLAYQKLSFNTLQVEETPLPPTSSDLIRDTLYYNSFEKKYELSTQLIFIIKDKGKNYKFTLTRAIVNSSEWAISIAQVVLLFFFVLLLLLSVANGFVTKRIWKPFYLILEEVKQFKISGVARISFPSTNIDEFRQLSEELGKMMHKMRADYVSLKRFSENASHEFQTPLAVIKLKLDALLQSPNMPEEELQLVTSSLKSIKKLSKLNEALLLLTKIENRQYIQTTVVDLRKVVSDKIENLVELIKLKNIAISVDLQAPFELTMNPILADLLIENLLSNAIKHNKENGSIAISCFKERMEIKNSGEPLTIIPEFLFERFQKGEQAKTSLGLGLAIAKEICNTYNLKIDYTIRGEMHTLSMERASPPIVQPTIRLT